MSSAIAHDSWLCPEQFSCICSFVDPNDPSQIYLTSPVKDSERLPTAPVYAANYSATQNESYQDMGLRP